MLSGLIKAENRADARHAFAVESNMIEREDIPTSDQVRAVEIAECGIKTQKDILKLHKLCTAHIKEKWCGKYRDCQVYIGNHIPPKASEVPKLMARFVAQLPMMDSWEAHNHFQKIHPFEDFNGRVGRLIWLSKAVEEGYNYKFSFLHQYYYQTLSHFKDEN